MPLQYYAEITPVEAVGMNPAGFILRGSDGLGNRPLGFMAEGSEAHGNFVAEAEGIYATIGCQTYGTEDHLRRYSDLIDSYMPSEA